MSSIKNKQTFLQVLPKDFTDTTKIVQSALKKGWTNGKEFSKTNNKGLISDIFVRTKYMTKEIKNLDIKQENIPILAAALGYIAPLPIPGLTIFAYFIARTAIKINKKLHKD